MWASLTTRYLRKVREQTGYEKSAPFYDLFDSKENIDFFHHYAAQAGKILDIGAGTGRIAIPLARRGAEVYCIEPSSAMRKEFEIKLQAEPRLRERITLIAGEAASFNLDGVFPAAILSGTFDHLLTDKERLDALSNIGRHLCNRGVLVFDVFLGLMDDSELTPAGAAKIGGREVRRSVGGRILPDGKKETWLLFEVFEGGELIDRIEERSFVGVTSRERIHTLLEAAGFEVEREWGSYTFEPFQVGDTLLVVQAVKRNTPCDHFQRCHPLGR